uniref:Uncharacterized protein n=1 Tax=Setaria digitata TaxID=48799 RepID=A0A915PKJ1_9BILA
MREKRGGHENLADNDAILTITTYNPMNADYFRKEAMPHSTARPGHEEGGNAWAATAATAHQKALAENSFTGRDAEGSPLDIITEAGSNMAG